MFMNNVRPRSLSEGTDTDSPPFSFQAQNEHDHAQAEQEQIAAQIERQSEQLARTRRIMNDTHQRQQRTAVLLQQLLADDANPPADNISRIGVLAQQRLSWTALAWRMFAGGVVNGSCAVVILGIGGALSSPLYAVITALFFAVVGAIIVSQSVNN